MQPAQSKRRFHAYCIGAPKTGTTSVADMFRHHYKAAHEPAAQATNRLVIGALEAKVSGAALDRHLQRRDAALNLELESAHPLGYLGGALSRVFPEARFIITLREPLSWLASCLNQARLRSPDWEEYINYFWVSRHKGYAPAERPLEALGLCSLDTYLQQYADHYNRVMREVPRERRLLLRTDALNDAPRSLAAFLGVPVQSVVPAHSHEAKAKVDALAKMDQAFVNDRIWHHCRGLIAEYFPETVSRYESRH